MNKNTSPRVQQIPFRTRIRRFVIRIVKCFFYPFFTLYCQWHVKFSFYWYELSGRWRARYYSRVLKKCGDNLIINGKPYIYHPELIRVGNNVTINAHAQIAPRGEVFIGNNVTMSRGSQITAGQLDVNRCHGRTRPNTFTCLRASVHSR